MKLSASKKHIKSPTSNPPTKVAKVDHLSTSKEYDMEYDSDTTEKSEKKFIPKVVKTEIYQIRISFRLPSDVENPHIQHLNLLQFLMEAVSPQFKIYNKRHEMVKESVIPLLSNKEVYNNHFELHSITLRDNSIRLYTVIQEVQSILNLEEMKQNTEVISYLKDQKIQLYLHEWTSAEWNVRAVGFLPQISPSHHTKENVNTLLDQHVRTIESMPKIRIRTMLLHTKVQNTFLKVRVYALEVQAEEYNLANKLLVRNVQYPAEYVPFRIRGVNEKAFNNSIAIAAQFQDDLRTVVVQKVSKESYFILENEVKQMDFIKGYHHNEKSNLLKLVVHKDHYTLLRQDIEMLIPKWTQQLDPSDTRKSGVPEIATSKSDDSSDDTKSQISIGIDSLLSMNMSSFTIFSQNQSANSAKGRPVSEVTMSTEDDRVQRQQEIIDTQGKRIEEMLKMIQDMKEATETKIETMIQLVSELTTAYNANGREKIPIKPPTTSTSNKRRPQL
jgi:hypothetical protein